jgi:alpha-aminoadipate carrier protein LysW
MVVVRLRVERVACLCVGRVASSMNAECSECAATVSLNGAVVGELLRCPECGADLEVITLDPAVLALAPSEEEDWGE